MYGINIGLKGCIYTADMDCPKGYIYVVDMDSKSCMYVLNIDRLEDYIYDVNMGFEGHIYALGIGPISDISNPSILYMGPKDFIYASDLLPDYCIL